MNFEIPSKFNYQEMCDELGISYEAFISFINSGGVLTTSSPKEIAVLVAIQKYLDHLDTLLRFESIALNTHITYKKLLVRLAKYLKEHNEHLTLDQLNKSIFLEFLLMEKSEKVEKLSNRTINTYTGIIRELFEFCLVSDLTEKNYKKRFTFKPVELKPRYLREDEVVSFLRETLQRTHGYRFHAIFSFLLGTGCRVSEVSKLRVCDFDIENNIVRIRNGKGDKERYIPLYDEVKTIVLDYLNLTGVYEWDRNLKGYLFSRDYGTTRSKPISVRSIERMTEVICKKLNFTEHYTTHSFRHTFAVRCLIAEMKVEYLSQILGHKSPETTYIYIQLFPKELQQHVTDKYPFALEKLLFRAFGMDD